MGRTTRAVAKSKPGRRWTPLYRDTLHLYLSSRWKQFLLMSVNRTNFLQPRGVQYWWSLMAKQMLLMARTRNSTFRWAMYTSRLPVPTSSSPQLKENRFWHTAHMPTNPSRLKRPLLSMSCIPFPSKNAFTREYIYLKFATLIWSTMNVVTIFVVSDSSSRTVVLLEP